MIPLELIWKWLWQNFAPVEQREVTDNGSTAENNPTETGKNPVGEGTEKKTNGLHTINNTINNTINEHSENKEPAPTSSLTLPATPVSAETLTNPSPNSPSSTPESPTTSSSSTTLSSSTSYLPTTPTSPTQSGIPKDEVVDELLSLPEASVTRNKPAETFAKVLITRMLCLLFKDHQVGVDKAIFSIRRLTPEEKETRKKNVPPIPEEVRAALVKEVREEILGRKSASSLLSLSQKTKLANFESKTRKQLSLSSPSVLIPISNETTVTTNGGSFISDGIKKNPTPFLRSSSAGINTTAPIPTCSCSSQCTCSIPASPPATTPPVVGNQSILSSNSLIRSHSFDSLPNQSSISPPHSPTSLPPKGVVPLPKRKSVGDFFVPPDDGQKKMKKEESFSSFTSLSFQDAAPLLSSLQTEIYFLKQEIERKDRQYQQEIEWLKAELATLKPKNNNDKPLKNDLNDHIVVVEKEQKMIAN